MAVRESRLIDNNCGAGSLVYSMANKINPNVGRSSDFIKLEKEAGGEEPSLLISQSVI